MTDGSGQPSFFEELKRRKVVRVAAVYGAIVFAVLQVALLLIEPLSLPEWAMRFLVLLGGLGLPVALWLAWIFEVRPEGLRRTAPAEAVPAEQIGQTSLFSRRTVLSVAALLLVGSAVGWFFAPTGVGSESPGDAAPGAGLMEIRPNGIAVLPFASRSAAEGEADFFAAGLHDDLLTRLAGLEALVVISRTSVEQYRETEKSIPEIGRELAVAYVLEGGVQKAGERLRVNAQLIDARTDEHLWAETFDGDLTVADIFAIQEELVGRIVAAMEATLGEDVVANRAEAPTESLDAWEALTRGRRLWARNDLTGAERAFEEAVQADPEFADAWARLSETASSLHWFGIERADEAREALDWTLFLAPDRPFTDWAKATYEYYVLTSYTKALASIEQAIEKAPGHDEFHFTRGNLLRRVGDFPGAAEAFSRAAELDPRNGMYLATLAETLAWMDDDRRLERWTDAAMDIPDLGPSSIHYLLATLSRRAVSASPGGSWSASTRSFAGSPRSGSPPSGPTSSIPRPSRPPPKRSALP